MALPLICPRCGGLDPAPPRARGSLALEVLLWGCLLAPGALYSSWRRRARPPSCRRCAVPLVARPEAPPLDATQPATPIALSAATQGHRRRPPSTRR